MKKVLTSLVVLVLIAMSSLLFLVGCGSNNVDNSNKDKTNNNQSATKNDLAYFKAEVLKVDNSLEETESLYQMIGAKKGFKLTNIYKDGEDTIEIYEFDKKSDAYKKYEKGEGIGAYDKKKDVKNGYVIFIETDYKYYNEVMEIFNKLK